MAGLRNDFKPFAIEPDAEVMSQSQWDEGTLRRRGHVVGLASQFLANKAERQGTLGSAAIGELITRAGLDAVDNGDVQQLVNALQAAVIYFAQKMLFDLLHIAAPAGESVLIGYDPVIDEIFGYPMSRLVVRTLWLSGGSPDMQIADYPDGHLDGGSPDMAIADYPDGSMDGGDPFTY